MMEYRTLGTTGIEVRTLCLGAMMFGPLGNDDEDTLDAIDELVAPGTVVSDADRGFEPAALARDLRRRRARIARSHGGSMTMQKLLVANRGEIAVRALRAAYELGLRTVAVYTHADRSSLHRMKADEAYEIGDPARPLAGYLDVDALVRTAVEVGADAIYPGYGFLSKSAVLAQACRDAGGAHPTPPQVDIDEGRSP